jgi:phosphatidylethanolamine-binding protein (PEBP) family uncharacterized protein
VTKQSRSRVSSAEHQARRYLRALRTSALICVTFFHPLPALAQSGFSVAFTWDGTKSCFDPQSPPFTLSGVPPETKTLRFTMKDLEAPDFDHGGGTIAYDGQQRIPRGAFTYRGPCPPQGQHHYEWQVAALDAAGKALAIATMVRSFPPQ